MEVMKMNKDNKDKIEQTIRLLQITQSCGMLKYFSSKEICDWIINIMNNKEQYMDKDYYYELKNIIDALISNKATNNKYVRFS